MLSLALFCFLRDIFCPFFPKELKNRIYSAHWPSLRLTGWLLESTAVQEAASKTPSEHCPKKGSTEPLQLLARKKGPRQGQPWWVGDGCPGAGPRVPSLRPIPKAACEASVGAVKPRQLGLGLGPSEQCWPSISWVGRMGRWRSDQRGAFN